MLLLCMYACSSATGQGLASILPWMMNLSFSLPLGSPGPSTHHTANSRRENTIWKRRCGVPVVGAGGRRISTAVAALSLSLRTAPGSLLCTAPSNSGGLLLPRTRSAVTPSRPLPRERVLIAGFSGRVIHANPCAQHHTGPGTGATPGLHYVQAKPSASLHAATRRIAAGSAVVVRSEANLLASLSVTSTDAGVLFVRTLARLMLPQNCASPQSWLVLPLHPSLFILLLRMYLALSME